MSVMSRTKAREIALHLIFEMGFQQFEEENLTSDWMRKSCSPSAEISHCMRAS